MSDRLSNPQGIQNRGFVLLQLPKIINGDRLGDNNHAREIAVRAVLY